MKLPILTIIPARGGSVRLPGKNIKLLNGKPLIAYSVEAWQKSRYYQREALVSTDSDDIAKVALQCGAIVQNRPAYLADGDIVVLLKYIYDTLLKYEDYRAGVILLLQPTSPLRRAEDIDACLDVYYTGLYDSVTSVCNGEENGAVYVTHSELLMQGSIYGSRLFRHEMPAERSIDIDTQEDFDKAEQLLGGHIDSGGMLHQLGRGLGLSKIHDKPHKRGRPKRTS